MKCHLVSGRSVIEKKAIWSRGKKGTSAYREPD